MITPNSRIRLVKAPFEIDKINQLTFANQTAQTNYFLSLPYVEMDKATYQREDGRVRFNREYDQIIGYNYCMYQNTSYSNKWFYAFIEKIEYANDGVSFVYLNTDAFQTWQFQIQYKNTFVEREHVNDDTIGLHTIPEGLETGEITCNAHYVDTGFDNIIEDLVYVISSAINLWTLDPTSNKYKPATPTTYNGIVSGTQYFKFTSASDVTVKLADVTTKGQIDAINGLFMAPSALCDTYSASPTEIRSSNTPVQYTNTVPKQYTLNGYTPINKKLLTGDYNYLLVSNNNGNSSLLKYEDFSLSRCTFKVEMVLTAGCSIRMIPTNYKNLARGDEYGINLGKLPICSYPCDMYTNWLTQNSVNVMGMKITSDDINVATSAVNTAGSVAMKDVGGTISGLGSITNSLIAKKQHELIPPQSRGNLNAGDVVTASGTNTFHFYKMSIRAEYARCIDNFFSMFGYKVNRVKTPNVFGRANWNYVKTIECNILGDIPQQDIIEIKNMFNNGVTFWHNPETFLDYSQNNPIV